MPDFYGDNLLTNPGAETGDTTGWTVDNATIAVGGKSGNYCFQVNEGGSMSQNVSAPSATSFQVSAFFLPEFEVAKIAGRASKFRFKTIVNYSDGSKDIYETPCEVEI